MSSPACACCCRRWNKVGVILQKLLLEGVDDEDFGGRCTGTANDGNGTTLPFLGNTIHQGRRRSPIPIQLRLAIVRRTSTNSQLPGNNNIMAEELGPTLLTHFPPLRSCEDDTSSSLSLSSFNTVATISEFMQFVVEDLFIGNREAHFLVHGSSQFVSMLLGDSKIEGRDTTTPPMVFRYGGKKKNKISGEGDDNNRTAGQTTSICTVAFSLLDETEGNAVIISPLDDAYETFINLILAQSKKKLDLILKAHVQISSSEPLPPPPTTTTTQETSLSSNVPVPVHNRKRKSITFADDEQIPKRGKSNTESIRINGIPPALSEALENQMVAPSLVNSNVRKSKDRLEVPVDIPPGQPKDANHTESDVADEDMISAPKNTQSVDAGDVGDEIINDAFKGAENIDGVVSEAMTDESIAKHNLESVQTIEPNAQGEELSADDDSSSSSSSSSDEEDEGKNDVETIGKSSSEEDDGEENSFAASNDGNQTNTTVSSNNEPSNISDGRIEIDAPDAAEEGYPVDSSSSSDDGSSSSSSSDDDDDDDDDSEIILSQSSNIAPTTEQSSEILVTNLPFASGKTTTPAISAVDNNAIFTQESELVPTILFGEIGDERQLRGKDMIISLAQKNGKRDDDSSSSSTGDANSSSTSSSSSSSDESDDEDDNRGEVCNVGADILRVGDKNAAGNIDATSPNKDGDESSSSSSSTGSSSSSDSSSDSDSDTDNSSSQDDGEKKAQQNSAVSGNIPPVVQSSSKGRRRAPLVPANRKIVINTSTVGDR